MTELKPCPFCGCYVKLATTDSFGAMLLHPKSNCVGWHMTRSIRAYSRMDREWLVNGWNERVSDLRKEEEKMSETIVNAVIEKATIEFWDGNPELMTFWIHVGYEESFGGHQGYGGFKINGDGLNGADELAEIMEVVGVSSWEDLRGKPVRVKLNKDLNPKIIALGNYLKNKWTDHEKHYSKLR